jgi:hypothetical protein
MGRPLQGLGPDLLQGRRQVKSSPGSQLQLGLIWIPFDFILNAAIF